jgi:hypothetical protein
MMVKDLRYGLRPLKILKRVKNLHVTMVLDMMKITNNLNANVNQKIVVAILLEQSLDGELIKNLQ